MRRALVLVLVLGACKGKHDGVPPAPPKRDAAPFEVDWARCEQTLRALPAPLDGAAVGTLIDGCRVCGDWTPILDWNRRQQDGGPTRQAIVDAMDRCNAFCDSTAKTYFMGTLDDARGTPSRQPWIVLGEQCKAAVSAVPDTRYMSAPYFALDRIARATAKRGLLQRSTVVLPLVSMTGVGVRLPKVSGNRGPVPLRYVLVLGGSFYAGALPEGTLGPNGIEITRADYPGTARPLDDIARDQPPGDALLIAPAAAGAATLVDAVTTLAPKLRVVLAVEPNAMEHDWRTPAMLAVALASGGDLAVDDKMTVQDLATAIAKLGKGVVGIKRVKP